MLPPSFEMWSQVLFLLVVRVVKRPLQRRTTHSSGPLASVEVNAVDHNEPGVHYIVVVCVVILTYVENLLPVA